MTNFLNLPTNIQKLLVSTYFDPISRWMFSMTCKDAYYVWPIKPESSTWAWFDRQQISNKYAFFPRRQIFPNLGDVPDCWAARDGYSDKNCIYNYSILVEAAARGYLEIVKRIHLGIGLKLRKAFTYPPFRNDYKKAILEASFFGHLDVLQYFLKQGCKWDSNVVIAAISGGRLDIFKFAMERKKYVLPLAFKIYTAIGKKGDVRFLEYLWNKYPKGNIKERCSVKLIKTNKFKNLEEKKLEMPCDINIVYPPAIENNHLEMVKWLVHQEIPSVHNISLRMSKSNLEMLKYLHEECKIKLVPITFNFPASKGNIEIINYLLSKGCRKSSGACYFAAINDQLETLKHLRVNGFKWNMDILDIKIPKRIRKWVLEQDDKPVVGFGYEDLFDN